MWPTANGPAVRRIFIVNLQRGQEIPGLHRARSPVQGAMLRLVRLNDLSVVSFAEFPWFKQATLAQITTVEWPSGNHPTQNIVWVTPEGGGWPSYSIM